MEESSDEDCSTSSASPNSPGVVSNVDLTATMAKQLVMSGQVQVRCTYYVTQFTIVLVIRMPSLIPVEEIAATWVSSCGLRFF